jgi:hypothetical protein
MSVGEVPRYATAMVAPQQQYKAARKKAVDIAMRSRWPGVPVDVQHRISPQEHGCGHCDRSAPIVCRERA